MQKIIPTKTLKFVILSILLIVRQPDMSVGVGDSRKATGNPDPTFLGQHIWPMVKSSQRFDYLEFRSPATKNNCFQLVRINYFQ